MTMAQDKRSSSDPIVAEVRKIKDRLASRYHYDAETMLWDAMRRRKQRSRKVVTLARRPVPGK